MLLRILLLLLLLPICVFNQGLKNSVIALIDKIPVIAETSLFVDSIYNGHELHLLDNHIQIAIAPRHLDMFIEHYFQLGKPLPEKEIDFLQYRITINKVPTNDWQKLPSVDTTLPNFRYAARLIDTVLAVGNQLLLEFRRVGDIDIIQQLLFRRTGLKPELFYYRNKNLKDTIDTKMFASLAIRYNRLKSIFNSLHGSTISIAAGGELQCLFKPISVNIDSSLEYRLRQIGKHTSAWYASGHLLSLPNLKSNETYALDVRYAGKNQYTTYTIQVSAFWYQTWPAFLLYTTILTAIIFLYFRVQHHRQVQARKQLLLELNNLQAKLNPHFVFNALGSIEGLVYQQDHQKANYYLNAFSTILRSSLLNSENLLIPLHQDISLLKKYMVLERLRYGFSFYVVVDDELPVAEIEFPPMLLQPIVENAVKHGVALLHTKGTIAINYQRMNKHMIITITDNGTGEGKVGGTGLGKKMTLERVAYLSRFFKQGSIECAIEHSNKGTLVTFFFENWLSN